MSYSCHHWSQAVWHLSSILPGWVGRQAPCELSTVPLLPPCSVPIIQTYVSTSPSTATVVVTAPTVLTSPVVGYTLTATPSGNSGAPLTFTSSTVTILLTGLTPGTT